MWALCTNPFKAGTMGIDAVQVRSSAHQTAMTRSVLRDVLSQLRGFFSAAAAAGATASAVSRAALLPWCVLMRGVTGSAPVCASMLMTGF